MNVEEDIEIGQHGKQGEPLSSCQDHTSRAGRMGL